MRCSFALRRTFRDSRIAFVTLLTILIAALCVPVAAAESGPSPSVSSPPPATPAPEPGHSKEPGAATDSSTADSSTADSSATEQARRTGAPVELADRTTETSQVLANPDGTFTLRASQRAVRVRRDGAWRAVDTTLRTTGNGSVAPVATDQDVTFSGGGTAPLVTVRHQGGSLAFHWPTPLPAPLLDGDTATYPAVLPGVDLRLVAHEDSYSQVLVVHDAPAAANPALARIRMTVTGTGLTPRVGADGAVSATDTAGVEVLRGAPPVMWDSTADGRSGPAPTAADPGSGRVTPLRVESTTREAARSATDTSVTDLAVVPDPAALTGKDVVYPLYIDPSLAVRKQHWTVVTDNGWGPQYDTNALAQVGYCSGWDGCNGSWRARSYFVFPTTALQHRNGTRAVIHRANVFAYQVWSADHNCAGGQPTSIWRAGPFNAGTNWPGPAEAPIDTEYSNAGGPCPSANLVFDVASSANLAAQNSLAALAFGLVAANENVPLQWKKFDNNPLLEVDFNFPPGQATNLRISNEVRCTGVPVTPDAQPTVHSTATDNNAPPLQLRLGHEVWNSTRTTMVVNTPSPSPDVIASGATGRWLLPDPLGDGSYSLRTAARNIYPGNANRDLWGPWSTWYSFAIDATAPATAPTVGTSEDYPRGYWGAPAGAPGMIPVSSPDSDIAGYAYTFSGSGTETVPSTTDCAYYRTFGTSGGWLPDTGAATEWIPVPAGLSPGYHTVHVKTFDDAHNMSAESAGYTFYVAPNTGLSTQKLEAESLPRSQPAGQNITIAPQSNCCGVSWSGGAQLSFNATAAGQSATLSFPVTATADYQLGLAITKATNYGIVSFTLDGTSIGGSFDGYANKVHNTHLPLGTRKLTSGTHTITITTTGTNPASVLTRHVVGIDYLTLTQTTRLQAERLVATQPTGQQVPLAPETSTGTGPGPFSEREQLRFAATEAGQSFDLAFTVPLEADYALGAALSSWDRYGRLRIAVDGVPLLRTDTTPWDGYAAGAGRTAYQPLGGAHLTAGTHTFTITVVGKNPASAGYHAGIDYLTAVPVNNVTTASFAAAMNNNGISADGTAAELDLNYASLSAQSLAAAGYAPGESVTIGGATFTMPAARSDGTDNVIAIGQTVPLPAAQQVKATAVGLLVASTCGTTPVSAGTLRFADNTRKDVRFPEVGDWVTGRGGTEAVTLPYRNEGTTSVTTKKPTIYAIFVPSDPTKVLSSVTLPNYGATLLPNVCSAPTLHVLAMAPRPVATGWVGVWSNPAYSASTSSGNVGFANQTLRTVVQPLMTGTTARIRLTNAGAPAPVTIGAASVAARSEDAATTAPPVALTFLGAPGVTIPAGGEVYSDPVPFPDTEGGSGELAVSLHFPNGVTASPATSGYGMPTHVAPGDMTADATGTAFTTRLYGHRFVAGVEMTTTDPALGTVAVLGSDNTLASGDDGMSWVEELPARLATAGLPVPGGLVNASSIDFERADQLDDVVNRSVLNQPNLRTVIIALGESDLFSGDDSATVRRELTALIHSTSATGLQNFRRTDGSPVHVILMTVPPQEDDAAEQHEQVRRQLNADILANYTDYGADEVIDIAGALANPADPAKTDPAYLHPEFGYRTQAYFAKIAQTITDAAVGFPPGAQL